jgi:hypothetical protein
MKKWCFVTGLEIQFLSYNRHLQFIIFMSSIGQLHELQICNSLYIWCNSLHSIKITHFQLLFNSIITKLVFCHVDIINCHPSIKI